MSKKIVISEEVYQVLSKLKLKNESYSDVIKRLLPSDTYYSDLAGSKTFDYAEWSEVQRAFQNKHLESFNCSRKKIKRKN
ncbi:MAG: antitoxin VapB family protein [Candidatus Hodarchaeales archaeon]